jgi:hypothetical protein
MKNWLQRQFKEFDNLKREEGLRLKQLKVPSSVRKQLKNGGGPQ